MQQVVLVAGGTGFLGREVVTLLEREGHRVIVSGRKVRAVPTHADVIINCVGIIRESGEQMFQRAHVEHTQWLLRLGKKLHVRQFVHVSAIGAAPKGTAYQRSKWAAEQAVIASGLPYAIIRPSMIFGAGDKSVNTLRKLCRTGFFPLLADGTVQPVSVSTVARVIAAATDKRIRNRIVEVGGPEVMTYRELADRIHGGVIVVRIPRPIVGIITFFGDYLSAFPTTEMVTMLAEPNTTNDKTIDRLGIKNPKLS
jgi:NADH dehydrogenase